MSNAAAVELSTPPLMATAMVMIDPWRSREPQEGETRNIGFVVPGSTDLGLGSNRLVVRRNGTKPFDHGRKDFESGLDILAGVVTAQTQPDARPGLIRRSTDGGEHMRRFERAG